MASSTTQFELWKKYCKTKDPEIRGELIIEYLHLVKYIAGRMNIYFSTSIEYDDIISFGVFGLIDAIDKFDITKGVKFETYATLRIRGSIIDNIRELDWVPRSLRQKSKELERLYLELETQNGRPPADKEIVDKMGISMGEYNKLLSDVNIQPLISLEDYLERNYS